MNEIIETINTETAAFLADLAKAKDGNKAAATRARKASIKLAKLYKEFRTVSIHEQK